MSGYLHEDFMRLKTKWYLYVNQTFCKVMITCLTCVTGDGLQFTVLLFTSVQDATLVAAISDIAETSSQNQLTAVSAV